MSPPQLDMQSKDHTIASVPGVTEPRKKMFNYNKTCMKITSLIIAVGVLAGIIFGAIAFHYHLFTKREFDTLTNVDGRQIPEHVKVDFHNEIIFVSNERNGNVDKLSALHNYGRKMIAFKDLTNEKCYIDHHDETFEEGLKTWTGREGKERSPPIRYFRYIREPIDGDVLRTFAGEEISEHCNDVPTHWIVDIHPKDIPKPGEFTNKTVQFICGPINICPKCPCRNCLPQIQEDIFRQPVDNQE